MKTKNKFKNNFNQTLNILTESSFLTDVQKYFIYIRGLISKYNLNLKTIFTFLMLWVLKFMMIMIRGICGIFLKN